MTGWSRRVGVVTGGSGALGQAVARRLLQSSKHVAILGRDPEKLERAILDISAEPERCSFFVADVLDANRLDEVKTELVSKFGRIDVLVTAAAASASTDRFEDLSLEQWRQVLGTDLDGTFLANQVFGSVMTSAGTGRIVNLTSFHTVATYPFRVAYNAAKAGVYGLSRALAVEWGHRGVTVNCVAPGPILTPRTQWFLDSSPEIYQGMLGRTPTKRLGLVDDVAAAVDFLASDEAGHITGQQIVIDGGWSVNSWWGSHEELL